MATVISGVGCFGSLILVGVLEGTRSIDFCREQKTPMSLGISIFLSAIILSITALFIATKDRWNWKKIVLRFIVGIIGLTILIGGGFYFYVYRDSIDIVERRPEVQEDFKGISLGTTEVDVRFFNDNPSKEKSNDFWVYDNSQTVIHFNENKVSRIIHYCSKSSNYDYTSLQGIKCNYDYHSVINKFGKPSFISFSKDYLTRVLSYKDYKVFFWLEQNRVYYFGVYDPTYTDAIKLKDEASIEEQPKETW